MYTRDIFICGAKRQSNETCSIHMKQFRVNPPKKKELIVYSNNYGSKNKK